MASEKLFTLEELAQYDGTHGRPVYLAIKGVVYDVTPGATMGLYGPGGSYAVFSGRECARALALMKIDAAGLTSDLAGLEEKHLKTLDEWVRKFNSKYTIVGRVVEPTTGPLSAGATGELC